MPEQSVPTRMPELFVRELATHGGVLAFASFDSLVSSLDIFAKDDSRGTTVLGV